VANVIVTGVDGSATAADAAQTAARLAEALDAELLVVCAYGKHETERLQVGGEEYFITSEAPAQKVASDAVRAVRRQYPDLRITTRTEEGKPAEALVRVAEQVDAELIVVGNRRVQGLARVLGSIAAAVAQKAPCDLYVANTHPRL
jgi:nucleotide-binding universal stress UspA family protein